VLRMSARSQTHSSDSRVRKWRIVEAARAEQEYVLADTAQPAAAAEVALVRLDLRGGDCEVDSAVGSFACSLGDSQDPRRAVVDSVLSIMEFSGAPHPLRG